MATCRDCYYFNSEYLPGRINKEKVVIYRPVWKSWCSLMKTKSQQLTDITACELFRLTNPLVVSNCE